MKEVRLGWFQKQIFESFWNLHSRNKLQHWRCIWMQSVPWGTIKWRERGWFWKQTWSSHLWWYRHGEYAIRHEGFGRERPFPGPKSAVRYIFSSPHQHFWRFCINIFDDSVVGTDCCFLRHRMLILEGWPFCMYKLCLPTKWVVGTDCCFLGPPRINKRGH